MDTIYLDANASTPLDPEVRDAMLPYLGEHFGNATSGHARGLRLRDAMAIAREQVAALLGCQASEIVFTSGGSESNNLAIKGVALRDPGVAFHIVTSVVEHPSIFRALDHLDARGWTSTRVGVDAAGQLDLVAWKGALRSDTMLATLILAQNETGVLQPMAEAARAARDARVPVVHCDAAQAVGKIRVKVTDLEVDLLSLAGHKFYGPWGVGALYIRSGTRIEPQIHGAGHEAGLRSSTPNVAGIVGLGKACELAEHRVDREFDTIRDLRDRLWDHLREVGGAVLHGHPEARLPNTLNVGFEGVVGSDVLDRAPFIEASTGSACHAGSRELSGVLAAMGVNPTTGLGALRLSLCRTTTAESIERAAVAIVEAVRELRAEARELETTGGKSR